LYALSAFNHGRSHLAVRLKKSSCCFRFFLRR
jgi:hypothetical protein